MAFTAKQHREHRDKCRVDGVCTRCRVEDALEGHTYCDGCLSATKAHRRAYRASGERCERCSRKLIGVDAGMGYCASCLERRSELERMNRW